MLSNKCLAQVTLKNLQTNTNHVDLSHSAEAILVSLSLFWATLLYLSGLSSIKY